MFGSYNPRSTRDLEDELDDVYRRIGRDAVRRTADSDPAVAKELARLAATVEKLMEVVNGIRVELSKRG